MAKILIIDDQNGFLSLITHVLTSKGYDVVARADGASGLAALQEAAYDLVICDIWMQPVGGMEILRQLRKLRPDLPVVMLTGHGSVETALESLNLGAFDYVTKPFEMADMIWTVERALEHAAGPESGEVGPEIQYGASELVANSSTMQSLMNTIRKLAPTGLPLLIKGEAGVGKRSVAGAVHELSGRPENAYCELNCAELSADSSLPHSVGGLVEADEGLGPANGTLCCINIEMLPPPYQSELLALLKRRPAPVPDAQENLPRAPADPRIIATSSANLITYVEQGLFDRELFEYINRFAFRVPALRERRQDILPLTHHFMREMSAKLPLNLDADVRALLEHYDWPGNVAELRNVVGNFLQGSSGASISRDRLPAALQKNVAAPATPNVRPTPPSARGRWLRSFLQAKDELARVTAKV